MIRLCANTGAELHLVEPLGFKWEDRSLKRAGLDYHEFARYSATRTGRNARQAAGRRLFAITTVPGGRTRSLSRPTTFLLSAARRAGYRPK